MSRRRAATPCFHDDRRGDREAAVASAAWRCSVEGRGASHERRCRDEKQVTAERVVSGWAQQPRIVASVR